MAVRDIPKPYEPKMEVANPPPSLLGDMNELLVGYYTKPGPANDPFKHLKNEGFDAV